MQRKSVPRQRSPGFEHEPSGAYTTSPAAAAARLPNRPGRDIDHRHTFVELHKPGPARFAAPCRLASATKPSRIRYPRTSRCHGRRRRSAIRSSHRHKRWISDRPSASRIRPATRYPVAETARPPAVRGGPGDTNGAGLYQPEIGAEALFPGAPVPGRARFSCPVLAAATEKPGHPVPARPRRTGRAVFRNSHSGFTAAGRAPGRNAAFQKPRNPLGHCMPPCRGPGNSTPGMPRKA
jgi:hypothetical protein